jgi:hypothetical protein
VFTKTFKTRLNSWITSSCARDRNLSISPLYLAIGTAQSPSTGDRDSLEGESLRIPLGGKFVEPVTARTRVIATAGTGDVNGIQWTELGLFDDQEVAYYLNRCDTLGLWSSSEGTHLYVSNSNAVQDNGALFCEFNIFDSSITFFQTVDLTDGKSNKKEGLTKLTLDPSYMSHTNGTTVWTENPIKIGKLNTASVGGPFRSVLVFDLKSIPEDATFTSVRLAGVVNYVTNPPNVIIGPYNGNAQNNPLLSGDSASTQYAGSPISTNIYVSTSTGFSKIGYTEVDLGNQAALTDIANAFASVNQTFAIGIAESNEQEVKYATLADPKLIVEYKRTSSLGHNARQFGLLSDILQFYFFISDTSIITSNTLTVVLGSSETDGSDQWSWSVRANQLASGWNLIQLTIGEATTTGSPSFANIKRFSISAAGTVAPGVVGLDNIRLFRKNGRLLNRIILTDGYSKNNGISATIQWIIDIDSGV